jgi:hypothetical protein
MIGMGDEVGGLYYLDLATSCFTVVNLNSLVALSSWSSFPSYVEASRVFVMSYPCLAKLVSFVSTIVFLFCQELLVDFRVFLS